MDLPFLFFFPFSFLDIVIYIYIYIYILSNCSLYLSFFLSNKKKSAACRIVGYDHGLPLPQGARALKGWYKGYELSKYGGEPHPLRGRYNNCGRKNYVRNIEESHPGYLHGLFTEAVGQYGESASWQKLAEVMNELAKSCGPEIHGSCEELRDLKMTRHRLRELFCANRTKGSAPVKKGDLCRGIIQQRQMEENDNDDSDGLCGKYDQS